MNLKILMYLFPCEATKRISKDVTVNSFGKNIIVLYSSLKLSILNGRIDNDQDNEGEWTC